MTANLTSWFFANSGDNYCSPRLRYACDPPSSACALDFDTSRWFCCNQGDYCWNDIANCATDGSTFECKNNDTRSQATWCCKTGREICNENRDYSCLSTVHNPLNDIPEPVLNTIYSNLTQSQPFATALSFDPYFLIAALQPAPTSTRTSSSTIASTAATVTVSPTPSATAAVTATATATPAPHHMSKGKIAGTVIGVLILVALIGVGVWYFLKKRRAEEDEPVVQEIQQREPVLGNNGLTAISRQPADSATYQPYYSSSGRDEFGSMSHRT